MINSKILNLPLNTLKSFFSEKTNQNVVTSYFSYIFTTMKTSGGTTLDSNLVPGHRSNGEGDCRLPKAS